MVIRNCRIVAVKDILYGGANVNGWLSNRVTALSSDANVKKDIIRYLTNDSYLRTSDWSIPRRYIKENQCYVALNPNELLLKEDSELPSYTIDEQPIKLTKELFLAPETIFNPALTNDTDRKPLIDEIYDTVLASDADPKVAFGTLANVVLAGGNTWFPGTLA